MLLCTLTTQPHATIYQILDGNNLIATVQKWQPGPEDELTTFKVPASELGRIDQIDDATGAVVATYEKPATVEDAIEIDGICQQSAAREWAETMDFERA